MSLSKKMTRKGTLQQVFYLYKAPSPPVTPYSPPLTRCIVYTCIQYTYSHREDGEGRGVLTREKIRGAIVHEDVGNTNITDSIFSL
jgi:hypothetical protein